MASIENRDGGQDLEGVARISLRRVSTNPRPKRQEATEPTDLVDENLVANQKGGHSACVEQGGT